MSAGTEDLLRAVEEEIEASLPAALERVQPALDSAGAKRPLREAPRGTQDRVLARHDPEYALLLKRAHDLNLRWNIEEGLY